MFATIHNALEWLVSTMAHHMLFKPQLGGGTFTVNFASLPKAFVLNAVGIILARISLFFLVLGYSMNGFEMV